MSATNTNSVEDKSANRLLFEFVQSVATIDMGKVDSGDRHELNKIEKIISKAWDWSQSLQLGQFKL